MHASEPLHGLRVVSTPEALDRAVFTGEPTVLRIAGDEAFVIGADGAVLDDPHAIVEPETAFVGWRLTPAEFAEHVRQHIEWPLPTDRPVLGQGLVAGLPLKLWFTDDEVLMIASRGLVHEVIDRLGVPA